MRVGFVFASVVLAGCVSEARRVLPASDPTVEITELAVRAAEASDERPRVRVRAGSAVLEATAAVRFGDGALAVGLDEALYRVSPRGTQRSIDPRVGGVPVVDVDGARATWSSWDGGDRFAVRWMDRDATVRTLAHGEGALAPLGFVGDRIALVGAVRGGVAGLWLVSVRAGSELRCVTNCELRAGRAWGESYVPPPGDIASITVSAASVSFRSADGIPRSIPFVPEAP